MPSFKEAGFLGDDVAQFRVNVRAAHAATFDLADKLNLLAMRMLWELPLDNLDEPRAYAVMCYARAVQNYQTAILMCERGALVEARTLIRAMAETVFLAWGFYKKQDMLERLIEDNAKHRKGDAKALLELGQRRGHDVQRFEQALAQISVEYPQGPRWLNWAGLASEVGLDTLFYLAYRQTSGDAAHATLHALHRHAEIGDKGDLHSFIFNPTAEGVVPTLKAGMAGMVHLLGLAVNEMGMEHYEADVINLLLEWRVYLQP